MSETFKSAIGNIVRQLSLLFVISCNSEFESRKHLTSAPRRIRNTRQALIASL